MPKPLDDSRATIVTERFGGLRTFIRLRSEEGSSLVEMAIALPILTLILLGTADFGRAYYLMIEVSQAANTAALYGSQFPDDYTGMLDAALTDAPNVPNFTAANITATHGCECSDGSSASLNCSSTPTCTTNIVTFVQIDTTTTYSPLFPYPGLPASIILRGRARTRASH